MKTVVFYLFVVLVGWIMASVTVLFIHWLTSVKMCGGC